MGKKGLGMREIGVSEEGYRGRDVLKGGGYVSERGGVGFVSLINGVVCCKYLQFFRKVSTYS